MRCVGFTAEDVREVMQLVAAVLELGDVDFDATLNDAARVRDPEQQLAAAARLLGVDSAALAAALTTRVVHVPGEGSITTPLTAAQAGYTRDAIAKEVYNRMFNQLVRRVNQTIEFAHPVHTIGVLDIFGFEIFDHNAFEQFCINYANEKLQSQFNDHVFKGEIREYEKEGIPFDAAGVTYVDNGPCIDLIEGKLGVIALLDEECSLGQSGEDEKFLHKLLRERRTSEYLSQPRLQRLGFTIAHYAGDVTYTCSEFLDKNMDTLREEVTALLAGARGSQLLAFLFSAAGSADASGGGGGGGGAGRASVAASSVSRRTKGGVTGPTVAGQFRGQLQSLVSTLSASHPHYVRCLKSNSVKKPRVFEAPSVLHQLRCAGVLESIRIRRSGYPSRAPHEQFAVRYRILAPDALGGLQPGCVGFFCCGFFFTFVRFVFFCFLFFFFFFSSSSSSLTVHRTEFGGL
jgi:myosin heavy subunit